MERSLEVIFLPLFRVVDLKTSNGLMPGLEHAILNIVVNLCLLVLRPRGSMVLRGSRIMRAPGILWSTPPVHISGERQWKARSLVWNLLFLLSGGPKVVWWWLLLRKPHSWAISLIASSVVSSLSLLCLVFLGLGAILWPLPFELLSVCVCCSILIRIGVLIHCMWSLYL